MESDWGLVGAFKVGSLEDIANLVDSMDGICIAIGDFNAVKSRSEREGSQFDANEAMSFSNFIANVGFHDFNMGARSNTYFNRSRSEMKIKQVKPVPCYSNFCFSLKQHFCYSIGLCYLGQLSERVISDHCPILLSSACVDFRPRPFRVFGS